MTPKGSGSRSQGSGLGGVFRSLGGFLDFVSDLAEKGEQTQSGEVGDDKHGVKGVYGFTVRVGGGGKPFIERFGNIKSGQTGAIVDDIREPMVDVFNEEAWVLVVAELPGIGESAIHYEIVGDELRLNAKSPERKYRKVLDLPCPVTDKGATSSFRNGVFELKLPKTTRRK